MTSRWHWITALLLLTGSTAWGQDNASHIPLDNQGGKQQPPSALAQQLMKRMDGRLPANGKEQEKTRENTDELMKRITGNKQNLLNNPEAQNEFLKNNSALKKLLKDFDTNDSTFQDRLKEWKRPARTPESPNQGEDLQLESDRIELLCTA
jgi:hypothetical protein